MNQADYLRWLRAIGRPKHTRAPKEPNEAVQRAAEEKRARRRQRNLANVARGGMILTKTRKKRTG